MTQRMPPTGTELDVDRVEVAPDIALPSGISTAVISNDPGASGVEIEYRASDGSTVITRRAGRQEVIERWDSDRCRFTVPVVESS